MEQEHAILEWIKQVENISIPSLTNLSNCTILCKICKEIAPNSIDLTTINENEGQEWSAYLPNCELLIHSLEKIFTELIESVVTLNITPQSLCRDRNTNDIRKICEYLIAAAVQTENREEYIEIMQSLNEVDQRILMEIIQTINDSFDETENPELSRNMSIQMDNEEAVRLQTTLKTERSRFNQIQEHYMTEINQLNFKIDDLENSRKEAVEKYEQFTGQLEINQKVMKGLEEENLNFQNEITRYKAKTEQSDNKLKNNETVIKELQQQLVDAETKARLNDKYRDKAERYEVELREAQSLAQESTKLMDKNEKLIVEKTAAQNQLEKLVKENTQLGNNISQLECKNATLEEQLKELQNNLQETDLELQKLKTQSPSQPVSATTDEEPSFIIGENTQTSLENNEAISELKKNLYAKESECQLLQNQIESIKATNNEIITKQNVEIEQLKKVQIVDTPTPEPVNTINSEQVDQLNSQISSQQTEIETLTKQNTKMTEDLRQLTSKVKEILEQKTRTKAQLDTQSGLLNETSVVNSIVLNAVYQVGQAYLEKEIHSNSQKTSALGGKTTTGNPNTKVSIPAITWMQSRRSNIRRK